MTPLASNLRGLGLALMAALYLWSGLVDKPFAWSATVAYAAAKGLPFAPLMVACSVAVEVLAPMALLVPRWRLPAALVLALYTLSTALIFHDFWSAHGAAAENPFQHFMKNLALTGAWLFVVAQALERRRETRAGLCVVPPNS